MLFVFKIKRGLRGGGKFETSAPPPLCNKIFTCFLKKLKKTKLKKNFFYDWDICFLKYVPFVLLSKKTFKWILKTQVWFQKKKKKNKIIGRTNQNNMMALKREIALLLNNKNTPMAIESLCSYLKLYPNDKNAWLQLLNLYNKLHYYQYRWYIFYNIEKKKTLVQKIISNI